MCHNHRLLSLTPSVPLRLAAAYPKTTFIAPASSIAGPPNFSPVTLRLYQSLYLTGYLAGLMTKSKKVCLAAAARFLTSVAEVSGFSWGVHSADPSVQVHIFGTGLPSAPLQEVWIVNQSYALGCDVVWVQDPLMDGINRANQLGMMSIGLFADARLVVGESVITSVVVEMSPVYLRVAEAVLNGTFALQKQRDDWLTDWRWNAMRLTNFSFLVPKAVQAQVLAQIPTVGGVFCGRVCTKTACLCNASTCCLNDVQLQMLDSYPDFTLDHGIVQLPGRACRPGQLATYRISTFTMQCRDCPAGTYAYNADQTSECRPCPAGMYALPGATNCTACPVGTYNAQPAQGQCLPCTAGSIAPNAASLACSVCSSAMSNVDGTQCESPSLLWLAGVGGGVAAGLVLIGSFLGWYIRKYGRRNNRAAPKDPSQAFCVLFTDIQGSTSLWATIPDVMATALDAHHALIRKLIAKHNCYEVKTIGDSFMCATKSPTQAVAFALALQEAFAQHDWGTDRIDLAYAELAAPEFEETPGCWNGLRVRTGIHYGYGDIKLDPVSRGYDYYGTVVNTAARIESVCHGGQTGVSAAVFEALGGQCPGAVWADLGEQPLRGLAEPIRLYQVLPEGPLSHRQFPPLRIDREDSREALLAEAEKPAPAPTAHPRRLLGPYRASVAPSSAAGSQEPDWKWAEHHPLVTAGRLAAEDLQRHHDVLHAALATLLAPLAPAVRQQLAGELSSQFHVPNHGHEGPLLLRTLDGLVKRTLPTAVLQAGA
eukprot:EG_transcript_4091